MTSRRTTKASRPPVDWLTRSATRWIDDATGTHWELTATWALIDGRATMVGLDVRSFADLANGDREPIGDHPGEVTQRVLRGIPLSIIREQTRSQAAAAAVHNAEIMAGATLRMPGAEAELNAEAASFMDLANAYTAKGEPRKRTPAATEELLVEVARLYQKAMADYGTTPAKHVEEGLRAGGWPVSARKGRDQVRKWIQRARAARLIPPISERRSS